MALSEELRAGLPQEAPRAVEVHQAEVARGRHALVAVLGGGAAPRAAHGAKFAAEVLHLRLGEQRVDHVGACEVGHVEHLGRRVPPLERVRAVGAAAQLDGRDSLFHDVGRARVLQEGVLADGLCRPQRRGLKEMVERAVKDGHRPPVRAREDATRLARGERVPGLVVATDDGRHDEDAAERAREGERLLDLLQLVLDERDVALGRHAPLRVDQRARHVGRVDEQPAAGVVVRRRIDPHLGLAQPVALARGASVLERGVDRVGPLA
mmetsp:Transcript_23345/g.61625  ORF Transcript_23345/g.61625 Transcript_23345/m.61625 type:complete len:266 (-) Transcript_23345:1042-1839(-)